MKHMCAAYLQLRNATKNTLYKYNQTKGSEWSNMYKATFGALRVFFSCSFARCMQENGDNTSPIS